MHTKKIAPKYRLNRQLKFFAVVSALGIISASVDAQPQCEEQTTKRRRPGQAECIKPLDSSVKEGAEVTTDTGQRNDARRPGDQQREQQAAAKVKMVTPRKASTLSRPTLTDFQDGIPVPDRWRLVDSLGYEEHWWDPYNRNILKGDKPLYDDWFFSTTLISDSVFEVRDAPTPVGASSTQQPGQVDVLGNSKQNVFVQNIAMEFVYYKGDTTFRPPDLEFRFTPVINYNHVELEELQGINADPRDGASRYDNHIGIQSAFVDYHLRNVSDQYDFDSVRVGIQPFTNDFRGFLFQDSPFGLRVFGTRDNNKIQYNIAWFRRLEKDTNSGLNDTNKPLRDDDVFALNFYHQDFPTLGFTSQVSVLHNRNRETEFSYDNNDFIVRPASIGNEVARTYDATYLGYSGDGHFGRLNLSLSTYAVLGRENGSVFQNETSDIQAYFAATEASMDFDWIRVRGSLVYASGDKNPWDDVSQGYDAVFENPLIAGSDNSYWIRQALPLIGGGRVALSGRNGLLPSLRSSKEQGQSNFTNPGLNLIGLGFDFDVLPELRLSVNWNYIQFDNTAVLEAARNQGDIDKSIGNDLSAAVIYRPLNNQNIVLRTSFAKLYSGAGYHALYKDEDPNYLLVNFIFTY